jgi:succinate--hydroxymethylglutarate CoA-transferase
MRHHGSVAPYQVFSTKNGYLMIGVGNDIQFVRMSKEMGHPEWPENPEFTTNGARVQNKAKLAGTMTEVLMTKTSEEWTDIFRGKGFPFGRWVAVPDPKAAQVARSVNNMEQVFNHPQAKHRNLVETIDVRSAEAEGVSDRGKASVGWHGKSGCSGRDVPRRAHEG